MNYKFHKGDLWGGISASAVMLPQATAFGIALWAPYSQQPALGAMAGLITAIALCFFSGLSRGTTGMVSAPTGPTMVLVSGALVSLSINGYSGSQLIIHIGLMLFISGLLQIIIGLSNGGKLIKFIPYPVVTGFMTGSALLMIHSQINMLELTSIDHVLTQQLWIPWLTALITFAGMQLVPRWLPKIPGTVSGLIVGSLSFHLLSQLTHFSYPQQWVVGQLPKLASIQMIIPTSLDNIAWYIILPVSLALAVLSSLDSLLTSVLADVATGERHQAKRELTGQGVGQMLAALFGGIAGAGTTGASLVAIKSGGRHWAPVVSALTFLFIILALSPVAALLPISVLAGIILHVAILGMLERDILLWLKRRSSRMDAFTALLVTAVTIAYDLMVAVAVGLILSVLMFLRSQILTPVIHRQSNIKQHPSLRRRTEEERNLLDKHADRIMIYELKGNLFFGTVDHLFEQFNFDSRHPQQIILDMARVQQVDLTAVKMLQQMTDRLKDAGGELLFTNVRRGKGLSHKVEKTLRQISPHHSGDYPVKTFIDADEAIEYAENRLLKQLGEEIRENQRVELEDSSLLHGLPSDSIHILRQVLSPLSLKSGDVLFYTNDMGKELYIVLEGEVDILLPYGDGHYKRLSKFGPGAFFGEIAFLKPGPRTADAKAMSDTELVMLSRKGFQQLREQYPETAVKLLMRLGRELSDRLRWSDGELRRLAE
ncbi:MAG: SulP family inorganic anion transporter [Gammaproteobacteria bacterium]|nr:SulP family inorganic anion transporter [Gammaproteobacteria bacterium]